MGEIDALKDKLKQVKSKSQSISKKISSKEKELKSQKEVAIRAQVEAEIKESENKTTVERLNGDDFDKKYSVLAERSREQIFTAFRATPNLFGFPNQTTGFNEQEYASSFKLYNRTVVRPIQNIIVDAFDKIYSQTGSIVITPFSLEEYESSVK